MTRTRTLITVLAFVSWRIAAAAAPVEVTNLQPFTHAAYIPEGADISSFRIEGVKAVKVSTRRRSVTDVNYCNLPGSEPGGSMYCSFTIDESAVPAYQVTYSFDGPPMTSDEYGNTHYTFNVYFRPEELSPDLQRALATHALRKSAAARRFDLTTYRSSIRQAVIDQAASAFCDGAYVDGNWTRNNPACADRVVYTTVVSPSPYIAVKIEEAGSFLERAAGN